jgi:hypothetical protein
VRNVKILPLTHPGDRTVAVLFLCHFSARFIMFVQLTKEFLGKPAGERIDVADTDADQLIRQGWAQPIENDQLTPTITRAVQSGLDDAVERSLQSWLRKQQKPARMPFAGLGDSTLDDPRAGFKHFGEFALAVRDACHRVGWRP